MRRDAAEKRPRVKVDRKRAEQAFAVSTVTRKSLAQELNDHIALAKEILQEDGAEAEAWVRRAAGTAKLKPDDERLTDEVCQAYADMLADAPDEEDFDEWQIDRLQEIVERLAGKRKAQRGGSR